MNNEVKTFALEDAAGKTAEVLLLSYFVYFYSLMTGRKQEIIKLTEQLLQAITSGDYGEYTLVLGPFVVLVLFFFISEFYIFYIWDF